MLRTAKLGEKHSFVLRQVWHKLFHPDLLNRMTRIAVKSKARPKTPMWLLSEPD
ncbi:hypothetical protein M378DRAFT_167031 [Amanita muscaria Koide BX008]|uniref:Uncharacterized protein n=1 Tax=Amanita muscaria (strain Koide BX008) TaxID=946122 RepID=A0A0C2WX32_AMAMK|nr:hypothetical protein M378DRAFT_167031 [Amanita muscaria Koide BX008]